MKNKDWKKSKYLDVDKGVLVVSSELDLGEGAIISLNKSPNDFWVELRVEGDNPSEVNISPLSKRIFKRIDEARGIIDEMGTLDDVESVIVIL